MIARQVAWLCLGLLVGAGCNSTVERGYYAPLGASFSTSITTQQDKTADLIVDVTCQGVYLNTVEGKLTRTAHIQLDITRTSATQVLFPVDGMRLDAIIDAVEDLPEIVDTEALLPDEVWSRRLKMHEMVLVNPWSNRSLDIFFDFVDDEQPIPSLLRFRWRAEADSGWSYGDDQFLRIPEGDPRIPPALPASDKEFGMRNGYYFPGYGVLGPRGLRDSVEVRPHYLFHAP